MRHSGFAPLAVSLVFLFAVVQQATAVSVDELADLRAQYERIEQRLKARDQLHAWQIDGMNSRIDQLGVEFLARLNTAAARLASSGDIDDAVVKTLLALFDSGRALADKRVIALERRAAEVHGTYTKFEQSAQADIARAFIADLLAVRESYLGALASQLDVRDSLGLDTETDRRQIRQRTQIFIEQLTGQIYLDAMSLNKLRQRLVDKPMDEDLLAAAGLLKAKQSRSLDGLAGMIDVADQLGIETTEQRSLLIRERGKIGADILKGEVFSALFRGAVSDLRKEFRRSGPDILLRSLIFIAIVLLAWIFSRLIRYPLGAILNNKAAKISVLLQPVILSVCSALVLLAGFIAALASVGVSLGPMLAGLGVLGVIVGLAVQDSLGNLAAGALILFDRPYDVDDHIRVNEAEGIVKKMNLVATTISTLDNQSIRIPNGRIWGDTIVNFTAHRVRRVDIKVSFAYSEDPDRVQAVLMDVLTSHDQVLDKPAPVVHMLSMEASSVAMMAKPWVRTEDYWPVYWDLTRLIKKRLDAEGIEIPFPQRVVTLVSDDRAATPVGESDQRSQGDV